MNNNSNTKKAPGIYLRLESLNRYDCLLQTLHFLSPDLLPSCLGRPVRRSTCCPGDQCDAIADFLFLDVSRTNPESRSGSRTYCSRTRCSTARLRRPEAAAGWKCQRFRHSVTAKYTLIAKKISFAHNSNITSMEAYAHADVSHFENTFLISKS